MARADLLVKLVSAGSRGDTALFRRTVEAIIAEERSKQHHVLADRLAEGLKASNGPAGIVSAVNREKVADLICETRPERALEDLILPEGVVRACRELVEEHRRRDLLRSYNLEPRHRVLLVGPPGNGKTSLAEVLAKELEAPLFVVRYEGVVNSYLGETAKQLNRVFEFARGHHCVLFFDEFDAVGKDRDNKEEAGEMRRVVNSLLLHIDALPSHVIVVAATNHPALLDRAVWRRFQLRLELPRPGREEIERWLEQFEDRFERPVGWERKSVAEKLSGLSFAEVEEFGLDIQRRYVLSLPNADLHSIVQERLEQLQNRARPGGGEQS